MTAARRRRSALLARLGIRPSVGTVLSIALERAVAAAEARSPGAVTALDAGCGRASPLSPFRSRIARLVGVDIHEPAQPLPYLDAFATVDLCGSGDAFDAGTFDIVLSNFTLEHFADPSAAMANLYHWLQPGGTLVASTVNRRHPLVAAYLGVPDALRRRLQPLVKETAADAHPLVGACNDRATILAVLEQAGFIEVELTSVGNLARAWGRRLPTFLLGLVGDLLAQPMPSRRSTFVVSARRPEGRSAHPGGIGS